MTTYEKTITHNLYSASGATGVVTQFWSDELKIVADTIHIDSGDQITVTFTRDVSAANCTAVVRKSDYTHDQTTAASTWNINHNLNSDALICQTFSGKEEILPDTITHDYNDSILTFSETVTGSAEFIWVQTDFTITETVDDPSGIGLSLANSYWKVGTGTTANFNATDANDVETVAASGSFLRYYESTLDSDTVILEIDVSQKLDINITEVGIFNDTGRLVFYTDCSPLFKPEKSTLKLFYKIRKFE